MRGNPIEVLTEKFKEWKVKILAFEKDTGSHIILIYDWIESYALIRDASVRELAVKSNVQVISPWGHTLYDLDSLWYQPWYL